ncbi:MAG: DUF1461 domain-containing protein [Actinobacteria bacterium]|nr:DUF1461 domain-containing protein [Actinomycetota bacterium]
MRALARMEGVFVGAVLALCLSSAVVLALTVPQVTATLVKAADSANITGLTQQDALSVAEQVRAYVADIAPPAPLPSTVEDSEGALHEGFTHRAVAHLDDVRAVFAVTRWASVALGLVFAVWLIVRLVQRQHSLVAFACRCASATIFMLFALALIGAVMDFDTLFAYFHKPLFAEGTWLFPAEELLVQLFPERFWMLAGALWAGTSMLIAGCLWVISRRIETPRNRLSA